MTVSTADDAEPELVYACDYCGRFTSVSTATVGYVDLGTLDDGRVIVGLATYCSAFCARSAWRASFPASRG